MKIGISAHPCEARDSVSSEYVENIVRCMPELSSDTYVVFVPEKLSPIFERAHPQVTEVTQPAWVSNPLINVFWHLTVLPWLLRKHACDCVYMPAGHLRLSWWYGKPSVGAVHEFGVDHELKGATSLSLLYRTRLLPKMLKRLTHVISASRSLRSQLVSKINLNRDRIDVVYDGADLSWLSPIPPRQARRLVAEQFGLDAPYILYTARLEHPGMNHRRLFEAFAQLKQNTALPHKLVCAGSMWYGTEEIHAAAADLGLANDVVFLERARDARLASLLAGADVFAYPALRGDSCTPILQAMASGTAVCASNVGSIPEVVGDAAVIFDPHQTDDIYDSLLSLLSDDVARERMAQEGLRRSGFFNWEDSARHILSICRAVMSTC